MKQNPLQSVLLNSRSRPPPTAASQVSPSSTPVIPSRSSKQTWSPSPSCRQSHFHTTLICWQSVPPALFSHLSQQGGIPKKSPRLSGHRCLWRWRVWFVSWAWFLSWTASWEMVLGTPRLSRGQSEVMLGHSILTAQSQRSQIKWSREHGQSVTWRKFKKHNLLNFCVLQKERVWELCAKGI